jgi:hypothetical protein
MVTSYVHNQEDPMKRTLLSACMIALLCAAALLLVVALRPAHAQGYFGGGDGGMGRYHGATSPSGPYRAINQDPTTGRTYAREADYLTPKQRADFRKQRVRSKQQ